jgi:hypothetical protein
MTPIPITLVVEDDLSEAVAKRLISLSRNEFYVGPTYGRVGFGYIKTRLRGFNRAARSTPFLVLADLDTAACPPVVIADWFHGDQRHPNLLFRLAVREVEAWLLAHREAFAAFAGVRPSAIPQNVEELPDPKRQLISIVSRSSKRAVREDIVPSPGGSRKQGPNYNGRLAAYVYQHWEPHQAKARSPSLARTIGALDTFSPSWAAQSKTMEG